MKYTISVMYRVATVTVDAEAQKRVNAIANGLFKMDKDIDVVDVYDKDGEWLVTQFRNGR